MTSKEFRMWLEGFLTTLNLDNVEIRKYHETYNHLTMLKTIHDKLKEVKDLDEFDGRGMNSLLTERFTPTTPPNPFEIKCENKK
jgi:two-component sensor histidine kinase|tara:strand:- start:364 stop:615 length:252 start_codon:yes stop_codon:yes gene_type:complete